MKIENTGGFVPFRVEIETKEDYELFKTMLEYARYGNNRSYGFFPGGIDAKVNDLIIKLERCGN